jgi:hypothetical protein
LHRDLHRRPIHARQAVTAAFPKPLMTVFIPEKG